LTFIFLPRHEDISSQIRKIFQHCIQLSKFQLITEDEIQSEFLVKTNQMAIINYHILLQNPSA